MDLLGGNSTVFWLLNMVPCHEENQEQQSRFFFPAVSHWKIRVAGGLLNPRAEGLCIRFGE